MVMAAVLVVVPLGIAIIGEWWESEAQCISRDINRLVRETKRREMEAREAVRARMRGTYAVYNKKAARQAGRAVR